MKQEFHQFTDLPRTEPSDHLQIHGQATSNIRDLAIGREGGDFRGEVNPVSRLILVVPVGRPDPIENRPREAAEFLNIEGSLVRSANFGLSWQAGHLTIVSLPRIELDENLLVLNPPAGVQIVDLLKNLGGHRELNDHLGSSCPGSGKENIPRSIAYSSNLMQIFDLQ